MVLGIVKEAFLILVGLCLIPPAIPKFYIVYSSNLHVVPGGLFPTYERKILPLTQRFTKNAKVVFCNSDESAQSDSSGDTWQRCIAFYLG